MATQTTNYGLKKPAYSDTADIGVINSNMDIIDAKMKEIDDKAGSGGGGGTSDYLQLSNKPKINGIELVNNVTTEGLGIVIPQYTSELVNDSGFITNETDPTVPAWAKEPNKPTYTAEEVGALPSNTPIPDPTSVVVDRLVSVGTHIADISVNGEKTELYAPTGGGGTSVTIDSELSTTSENPVQNKVITQALDGKGTYSKPTGGIPKTDLASEVQTSLGKADTALQEHQDISGKADKTEVAALSNSISDAWNNKTAYTAGQCRIHNNILWKCLVANTNTEPAEGTYWTQTTIDAEIASVNSSLNSLKRTSRTRRNITSDLTNLPTAIAEQDLEKYGYAIGDYFVGASGYYYHLADMDTNYGGYDSYSVVSTHHCGIVVDTKSNCKWLASGSVTNYSSSTLHSFLTNTALPNIKSDIATLFGDWESHLLKRTEIDNSIGGFGTNWDGLKDCLICAMTEVQMYGARVFGADGYQTGTASKALELFRKYRFNEIYGDANIWLKSLISASVACGAFAYGGDARSGPVSSSYQASGLILFH